MTPDEQAVRQLVADWMAASRRGDMAAILEMITDDVEFLVVGQKPFGKAQFAAMSAQMSATRLEGDTEVREVQVTGDWAWIRNQIDITITPPGGAPMRRSGPALTVLRKGKDGRWRISRDANFVVEAK